MLASNLDVCGLSCDGYGDDDNGGGGGDDGGGDSDGDGTPDDEDDDGDSGSGAGGNSTKLTKGDTTIVIENSKYKKPTSGTALSVLSGGEGMTPEDTTAAILSPSKPGELRFSIDTRTASNNAWAVPIFMEEYLPGTNDPDPFGASNGGAGGNYREYRALSDEDNRDEVLQVWAWDDSYAVQYRNASGGGEAKHQAWAFGGNAATAMPMGGSATYSGRFVATAKTKSWAKPDGADIDPNNLWRLQGSSNVNVNFGSGTVNVLAAPETWTGKRSDASDYTWYVGTSVGTATEPHYGFYDTTVSMTGRLNTTDRTKYSGTAKLSGDFVSGDAVMHGGFYGNGAAETAGIFNVYGVAPDPIGGSDGINDDRRGFLTINGAFHGDCQAGGACTP